MNRSGNFPAGGIGKSSAYCRKCVLYSKFKRHIAGK